MDYLYGGLATTSFGIMCCEGEIDIVRAFLERTQTGINDVCGYYGFHAIHLVAHGGHVNVMRILVEEYNVNTNVKTESDMTPLMYAVANCHLPMVTYLVDHGADINAMTKHNRSALSYASDAIIIEYLMSLYAF